MDDETKRPPEPEVPGESKHAPEKEKPEREVEHVKETKPETDEFAGLEAWEKEIRLVAVTTKTVLSELLDMEEFATYEFGIDPKKIVSEDLPEKINSGDLKKLYQTKTKQAQDLMEAAGVLAKSISRLSKIAVALDPTNNDQKDQLSGVFHDIRDDCRKTQELLKKRVAVGMTVGKAQEKYRKELLAENGFSDIKDIWSDKLWEKRGQLLEEKFFGLPIGRFKYRKEIAEIDQEIERRRKINEHLHDCDYGEHDYTYSGGATGEIHNAVTLVQQELREKISDFFKNALKTPGSVEKITEYEEENFLKTIDANDTWRMRYAIRLAVHGKELLNRYESEQSYMRVKPMLKDTPYHWYGIGLAEESELKTAAQSFSAENWQKAKKQIESSGLVTPENLAAFERLLGRVAAAQLGGGPNAEQWTEHHYTRELTLSHGYRSASESAIMAYATGDHEITELFREFALRQNDADTEYIKNHSPLSARVLELVRSNPEHFDHRLVTNSERSIAVKKIMESKALQKKYAADHDFENIETLYANQFSKDLYALHAIRKDGEREYIDLGSLPPEIRVTEEKTVKRGDPEFETLLQAIIERKVSHDMAISVDEGQTEDTVWRSAYELVDISQKYARQLLEEAGLPESDILEHEKIPNPVYKEISELSSKIAINLFLEGAERQKRLALQTLALNDSTVDLKNICDWVERADYTNFFGGSGKEALADDLENCAIRRGEKGDKQIAMSLITRYAAVIERQGTTIPPRMEKCFAAFVERPISDEEKITLSKAFQLPAKVFQKVQDVYFLLREINHTLYSPEKFQNYAAIAEIPEWQGLINDLHKTGCNFIGSEHAEQLKKISDVRGSVLKLLDLADKPFEPMFTDILVMAAGHLPEFEQIEKDAGAGTVRRILENCYYQPGIADKLQKNPEFFGASFEVMKDSIQALGQNYELNNIGKIISDNFERLMAIPAEKRLAYVEVSLKIDNSPSQEIQKIKMQLIAELMESPNPAESYRRIEEIFVKNNLPEVGKIFKIFQTLYPAKRLDQRLSSGGSSPVIKGMSSRGKYYTFYRDLLRCHIGSGNRSLTEYAKTLAEGQDLITIVETDGEQKLTEEQKEKLLYIAKKFNTLLINSQRGNWQSEAPVSPEGNLDEQLNRLRSALGVKAEQRVGDRVAEMYLRPLGLNSLRELLIQTSRAKSVAHDRNVKFVQDAGSALKLKKGDLLKGIDLQYLGIILQNGSVAKEFLGTGSQEDATPMDTDVAMVKEDGDTQTIINKSMAKGYANGGLLFAVRDRGQFQFTNPGEKSKYQAFKYELISHGAEHHGIRTGFPTSEIDFMVALPTLTDDVRKFRNICFEIAKNDCYIPIVDESGKILFSPDDYRMFRNAFAGLDRFGGRHLRVDQVKPQSKSFSEIQNVKQEIKQTEGRVAAIGNTIREAVRGAVERAGLKLKSSFDSSIEGVELYDTGSTGRGTNLPESIDFDFSIQLDARDGKKMGSITADLKSKFRYQSDVSHSEGGYEQIRLIGVTQINGQDLPAPVDLDIGVSSKAGVRQFETHDALSEKLDYISRSSDKETRDDVIANIILAKRLLKKTDAYKKTDGGIGGVGVETWILNNNGNAEKAFAEFWRLSHDQAGAELPFDEFQKRASLYDPGINIKTKSHDDFFRILKENGYHKMIEIAARWQ